MLYFTAPPEIGVYLTFGLKAQLERGAFVAAGAIPALVKLLGPNYSADVQNDKITTDTRKSQTLGFYYD